MAVIFGDPGGEYYFSLSPNLASFGIWSENSSSTLTNSAPAGRQTLYAIALGNNGNNLIGLTFPNSYSHLIVGFAYYISATTWTNNQQLILFRDATTSQCDLRTNASGQVFFTRNGTTIGSASTASLTTGWQYLEVEIVFATGATGSVQAWSNGVSLTSTSSVQTTTSGNASANMVRLISSVSGGGGNYLKDIYMLDATLSPNNTRLGDITVAVQYPTEAGTYQNWSPLSSTQVSQVQDGITHTGTWPDGDSTYIFDNVSGDVSDFAHQPLAITGNIYAVIHASYVRKDISGNLLFNQVTVSSAGGVYENVDGAFSPSNSYLYYFDTLDINPDTNAQWSQEDYNATTFGDKIEGNALLYVISPQPTVYQGKAGGWAGIDPNSSTWTNVSDVYFPAVTATFNNTTTTSYVARDSGVPAFSNVSSISTFFGMNITLNQWNFTSVPLSVSVQSYRFWDNGCRWDELNQSNGSFNFSQADKWLNKLRAFGISDCIFELGGTPQFCTSNMGNNCDYSQTGTYGYCSPPTDLNSNGTGANLFWRNWCKQVGLYFSANTDILCSGFCTWNEFSRQPGVTTGPFAWVGTNQQMVRLSEDARAIILGRGSITATGETAAQAQSTVGLSGAAYSLASSSNMLSPTWGTQATHGAVWTAYQGTSGATAATEVVAIHAEATLTAGGQLTQVQNAQKLLNSTNAAKPMWITEIGWLKGSPNPDPATVITGWYTSLYGVVQRMYWYQLVGASEGLQDSSGTLNSAGTAYNSVYTTLNGGGGGGFQQVWVTIYDPTLSGESGSPTLSVFADPNQSRWSSPGYIRVGTLTGVSSGGASGGGGGGTFIP